MKQLIINSLPTTLYLTLKRWNYKRFNRRKFNAQQKHRLAVDSAGYSFKPFDDKKAIFIHVPKCAGVAVSKAIFGNLAGGHTSLQEHINIFEPHAINRYFKFTIVRNPWDRLVSAYFFLKQGGFNESDRIFFEKELSTYIDFNDFVKKWVNRENIWTWTHFHPQQHYFLEKRRKVSVDFIGFHENLEDDFNFITKQIGVNCQLNNHNKSNHLDYKKYYDDETKHIVEEVYKEDIDLLGYNFDNSSLQAQLSARLRPSLLR